jgi:hypothetical protein
VQALLLEETSSTASFSGSMLAARSPGLDEGWRYGSLDLFYDKFGFFIIQQHASLLLMAMSDWAWKIIIVCVRDSLRAMYVHGLFLHVTMTTLCSFSWQRLPAQLVAQGIYCHRHRHLNIPSSFTGHSCKGLWHIHTAQCHYGAGGFTYMQPSTAFGLVRTRTVARSITICPSPSCEDIDTSSASRLLPFTI